MMAKTLAMMCVREAGPQTLHSGFVAATHTGNYSNVGIIDADGRYAPAGPCGAVALSGKSQTARALLLVADYNPFELGFVDFCHDMPA